MPAAKREQLGTVFRGTVAALEKLGIKDAVKAKVSAEARALIDKPPIHVAWLPCALQEELLVAAGNLSGRESVRTIGYEITRGAVGPIILPLIKLFLTLSGGSLAGAFKNFGRLASMQFRGLQFGYTPHGDRAGLITITYDSAVHPYVFASWEGSLLYARDVTKEKVMVAPSEIDGLTARIRVSW